MNLETTPLNLDTSQGTQETPAAPETVREKEALSVSAALALAKEALESLTLTLIGEVSELSHKPGYKAVYFSVKDSKASLPCMMWLNRYESAGIALRVGMLVEITGRFSLYAAKGRMNFDVFKLAIAGEGDLRMRVAELAKRLATEGLMEPGRKRPLPRFPTTIAVVTSPRGAVVHDVLRTLRRRYPLAKVQVAGVPVEGADAGMAAALDVAATRGAEVILLVRGGGSFEDLMPFNDEALARAIAASPVPVVTGIGHEPDTTIADMVSDLRASTPTAAAEAVSPAYGQLRENMGAQAHSLKRLLSQKLERHRMLLAQRAGSVLFTDSNALFAQEAQALDDLGQRLHKAIPSALARDVARVSHARDRLGIYGRSLLMRFDKALAVKASRLQDLSPLTILARGYSFVQDEDACVVKSVEGVNVGASLVVNLHDGTLDCRVEEVRHIEKVFISWED